MRPGLGLLEVLLYCGPDDDDQVISYPNLSLHLTRPDRLVSDGGAAAVVIVWGLKYLNALEMR